MPTTTRIQAISAYRSIPRATERYMEERLWQRALERLEGPPRRQKGPRRRSFAAILRDTLARLGSRTGRRVDLEA
jgi:hypothetical protein